MSAPLLNPPQRAAIHYLDGPLLVLAGAGSGKTRVITYKIAHLVREGGIPARHIAAITFTNKAAREMLERVGKLMTSAEIRGITVSTFHSLGMHILRQEAPHLGYKPQFSILDSYDAGKIIADILNTTSKDEIRKVQSQISLWKNDLKTPDDMLLAAQDQWESVCAQTYLAYQDTLTAYQAMDFDDLIRLPVQLFREHPEVLLKWQGKLRYLLIDEYQDTNTCQYQLVKLLTGVRGLFTAVGDDDQSIYAWRGANMENLRLLQQDFPALKVIKLEQNYRSTARILRAANSVISNNPKLFEKQLWSELGLGEPIHVVQCKDEEHEAETVVQRLLAHKFECRTEFKDYAILYRGNYQARIFEQALRNQRIPYQMAGGQSFFDKPEIKDLLAYMRLIANPDDDPAFIRAITTPKRGVGAGTLEKLGAWSGQYGKSLFAAAHDAGLRVQIQAAQLAPLEQFCDFISQLQYRATREEAGKLALELLQAIGYEAWLYDGEDSPKIAETKWKNLLEMVAWLARKGSDDGKNLIELTQTIALITMLEGRDEGEVDAVRMSTLHASKGLEYPHVFLVGCEEGILPHSESVENGMVEEERRLMYVGITRAQRSLTLSYCVKRRRAGEWQFIEPSRFISEIDGDDLRHFGKPGAEPLVSKTEGKSRLANLTAMLAGKDKSGDPPQN
ncbi:UvrD-helicase domain-containing protein [Chromobacterium phragmitis]|uniref:UvrD-helicase domain-containing protein n=1 Tax=Chromobacterium amazonense TaxID=1382803 RepID=UPI000582A201|nr:UvrD-helicase domain-containing protein [Chromobacterium amazonense]KIA81397.1 ATP-dependent DNA helicase Rep [Chromobacterium piscinae]MBM2886324.1 UvrD-helicase domain-containing protein [Chromobacterium amazonense]